MVGSATASSVNGNCIVMAMAMVDGRLLLVLIDAMATATGDGRRWKWKWKRRAIDATRDGASLGDRTRGTHWAQSVRRRSHQSVRRC